MSSQRRMRESSSCDNGCDNNVSDYYPLHGITFLRTDIALEFVGRRNTVNSNGIIVNRFIQGSKSLRGSSARTPLPLVRNSVPAGTSYAVTGHRNVVSELALAVGGSTRLRCRPCPVRPTSISRHAADIFFYGVTPVFFPLESTTLNWILRAVVLVHCESTPVSSATTRR